MSTWKERSFSIITVSYNDVAGLTRTIKSVINQTLEDYEFIIVDGGSSDGSKEVIELYEKSLTYWCSEPDNGIYNAMNKGVLHANGKYLIFMNAGDIFFSDEVLEQVFPQLDNKDIVVGYALKNGKGYQNIHEDNVLMMLFHSSFSHQATFIKRDLFQNYKYDEHLRIVSDWKAWVDWIVKGRHTYKYIDTIVANYDFTGISSDSRNWDHILSERAEVLANSFPPLVLENLKEYHEIYLKGHIKYLKEHPTLIFLCFSFVKVMALVGKVLSQIKR